ncbi:MAG: nuclear transport factor 2 family protein [Nocardioidaceae bacterium]
MGYTDIHKKLHGYFNKREWDSMDAHMRADVTYEDSPRGLTTKNIDEFKDWLREWEKSFSDAKVSHVTYFEGENFSLATFSGTGTNDGQLGPFPASKKRMDNPMWEMLHFDAEGKVASGQIMYDQVTMLGQLGHIDLPG